MAQPQPQPPQQFPMPQRPFSPPQSATSPGTPSQFTLPPNPNKRQRLSPNPPSQPGSPYVQSPYAMSPGASGPPSATASPHFQNIQLPPNVYNTPYSNGNTTPTLNHPQPPSTPTPQTPNAPPSTPQNGFAPPQGQQNFNYMMPPQQGPQGTGAMGPPSKPQMEKKEDGADMMDVLGGTGIDLREEEQYTFQLYNTSFNSQVSGSQSGTISASHSFTQFPPGSESSFYGAGPANTNESIGDKSQEKFEQEAADAAWQKAAKDIAVSRSRELNNPFLQVAMVHKKAATIARENGLVLNTDMKGSMGHMKLPDQFDKTVNIKTKTGPDGALVETYGVFVPEDSFLVDQLALLSIATKHRLRLLLEDAVRLTKGRQTGSHGNVPAEWADAAAPVHAANSSLILEDTGRSAWDSAVSPQTNPLKRSLSSANLLPTPVSDGAKTPATPIKFGNEVVNALRASAAKERDFEEARLRKRQARTNPDGTPRQGSVAPGTPGSIAPEPNEKPSTKKEQKKKQEAKINEAASHESANATSSKFLGGGGGLFGKKKKYSWMTGGAGGGSGASTPAKIMTQGLPGTPGGGMPSAPEKLTSEGARRLGTWREDHEKGKNIQLRDWITVLEDDGKEKRALQMAYALLDDSQPK
ncbi:hypothetical protein BP5796_04184 [Coleophoma crateriformis]|uniref:Transcription initiation factor TFIID subunit 4 n=1 Tax=Coleophoma crateriformis TaxID=565419 RepID=A0A3D8SHN3_9HELO|nr:hypothetical protein BP5796_04184 [Coleophoma crateriformis]